MVAGPNKALQQTTAATLASGVLLSLSAAAATDLYRSAVEGLAWQNDLESPNAFLATFWGT
jgi:hypothetical protein